MLREAVREQLRLAARHGRDVHREPVRAVASLRLERDHHLLEYAPDAPEDGALCTRHQQHTTAPTQSPAESTISKVAAWVQAHLALALSIRADPVCRSGTAHLLSDLDMFCHGLDAIHNWLPPVVGHEPRRHLRLLGERHRLDVAAACGASQWINDPMVDLVQVDGVLIELRPVIVPATDQAASLVGVLRDEFQQRLQLLHHDAAVLRAPYPAQPLLHVHAARQLAEIKVVRLESRPLRAHPKRVR
mmetsp:Transcript_117658/g.333456  ORF Transcript_117658/g.333456 Transcript_117658/m.333456 type:complete len:246 (+) Transcript_117658:944-1681(+)